MMKIFIVEKFLKYVQVWHMIIQILHDQDKYHCAYTRMLNTELIINIIHNSSRPREKKSKKKAPTHPKKVLSEQKKST